MGFFFFFFCLACLGFTNCFESVNCAFIKFERFLAVVSSNFSIPFSLFFFFRLEISICLQIHWSFITNLLSASSENFWNIFFCFRILLWLSIVLLCWNFVFFHSFGACVFFHLWAIIIVVLRSLLILTSRSSWLVFIRVFLFLYMSNNFGLCSRLYIADTLL